MGKIHFSVYKDFFFYEMSEGRISLISILFSFHRILEFSFSSFQVSHSQIQPASSTTPSGIVRRASRYLKRKIETSPDEILEPLESESDDDDDDEDLLFNPPRPEPTQTGRWVSTPPAPLTKRRKADIVKEKAGPRGRAKSAKTELAAFELFFDTEMINRIVDATNFQIQRERATNEPRYSNTCANEIKCLIGVFLFRGLNYDIKIPTEELWYHEEVSRQLYRASMSRDRFHFLLRCLSFHDQANLRRNIVEDPYAKMRWFIDHFETNARRHYKHTELVCLDETLRNFFSHECDLRVFMPDKPGQMGIFFYTLGDGIDRYFSRVIPKKKAALSMSAKEAVQKTNELVMEITSDIHYTGRNLTADRGFSSIEIAKQLYHRDVTFVGTIKKKAAGLPSKAKEMNNREIGSTEFFWKKEKTPLMLVSYYAKKGKPVLLITTAHEQPTVDVHGKKKPEAILFYNEQRCGVDIVNRMLKTTRSQPKTDEYKISIFTFILDISAINAHTIFKYNTKKVIRRREFTRNIINQLVTPWLKHRFAQGGNKMDTVAALKACLSRCDPTFDTSTPKPVKPPGVKAKCFLCLDEINNSTKGNERKRRKKNINKHSWFCPVCKLAVCTKPVHRVFVLSRNTQYCRVCAQSL